MLLPKFLHGTFPEVRRRVPKYITAIERGEPVELVDTRSAPGVIVIDDQEGFRGGQENFQMHAIFEVANGARYRELRPRIFDAVLVHQWGPLSLFGILVSLLWIHGAVPRSSWASALTNVLKWWDVYTAEGERFAIGTETADLWTLGGALKGVLHLNGIPFEELRGPLPDGELRNLLARYPEKFQCVLERGSAAKV